MTVRLGMLLIFAVLAPAQQREAERPVRHPARGVRGAVAAGSGFATEAGMRIYHRGGNAVDAGIAAMLAASVTEFSHFGLGGEAPILVRTRDGKVHAIAGVGTMPKLATADFFRKRRLLPGEIVNTPDRNGLPGMVPVAGLMPALVPGMIEAALVTLREYGTKIVRRSGAAGHRAGRRLPHRRNPLRGHRAQPQVSRPVARLEARVPARRPRCPSREKSSASPTWRAPCAPWWRWKRKPPTAAARKAIDAVRDFFYRGDIARRIDRFSRENDGLLRYEDMAAFRVEPEAPVTTTYRGYQVYKPGFWSQGPSLIETLNILEGFDLREMKRNSAPYIHTVVEALKLAYADRDTYYGDPRFSQVPAARLLSKEYAAERRKLIGGHGVARFPPRPDRRATRRGTPRNRRCPRTASTRADGARHHLRGRHR